MLLGSEWREFDVWRDGSAAKIPPVDGPRCSARPTAYSPWFSRRRHTHLIHCDQKIRDGT